jgi:fatty-acyl-CoA synthase
MHVRNDVSGSHQCETPRSPLNGLSYVRGSTEPGVSDVTVSELLQLTRERFPDRLAVVFREQGIRWTWRELAQEVDALANGLIAIGVEPGTRVGIWSPNRAEWLLVQFATARIGATMVCINPSYRAAELEYALNKVGCRVLVAAEGFKNLNYSEILIEVAPELQENGSPDLQAVRLPALRTVVSLSSVHKSGMLEFAELVERGRHRLEEDGLSGIDALKKKFDSDDAVNIQFTSGTTGRPKAATLTHRNIVNNGRYVAMCMGLSEEDRLCVPVPLYHCFGMVMSVLACVSTGAAMIFPGETFSPAATLLAVHDERCTALHGVPTMFIAELEEPDFAKYDLSSLRTGIMAGSPCPVEAMRRVVSAMHLDEITIAYGMTETSPVSFQTSKSDAFEHRISTVGRIQPNLEAKIVDPNGDVVAVGVSGQLCVKGYSVMKGYWDDVEKTREVIIDEWMYTGDLATIDSEGYCKIVGRLNDMVIRGGENIYPREIEEILFTHPKIQTIQVFGVPHPKYGEEICAWIILRPEQLATSEEIQEFCLSRMARYKVPQHVRFVDSMPMTVTGKIQKYVMRDAMIELLGESSGDFLDT